MDLNQFRDVDLVIDRANDSFIQRQFVSQGDYKGRTLTVQVTNNGVIGEVLGLSLNLRWQNQGSGLTDLSALTLIDKAHSIYRIEYPQHMMTPGTVVASIQVVQNGKSTFTKQFQLTVQKLAGEPVGIVEKAEFSALVAVLADSNKFRTDIDGLDATKASKTELQNLGKDLDGTITTINGNLTSSINSKVDKNGAGQVTWGMLSQDAKNNISGDKVAIVGKDSVSTTNIVDRSVTDLKVSAPILKANLVVAYIPPNYDTTKKTFTFNGIAGIQDVLLWGNGSGANQYIIPAGLEIKNTVTATTAYKLVFNVISKEFRFLSWGIALGSDDLLIMSFRVNQYKEYLVTADFPIHVDGYPPTKVPSKMPTVQILGGGSAGNNLPSISSKTKTLNFPSGYDWIFSVDGERYSNAIPANGLTIDLSKLSGSTAFYFIFNKDTKKISTILWEDLPKYANGHALLGTIRILGQSYSAYLPFPFTIDGKLFGYQDDNESTVSVSLDAPVKCIHHRGYSRKYPENTEIAYKGSKKIGVNEIEMDLVFTSDGIPVNLHDMTINRTARNVDGSKIDDEKYIEQITYEEAAQYDYGLWKSAEFKNQKLMTFEDCIKLCKKLDMRLHVDRASVSTDKLLILKSIMDKHRFDKIMFYSYSPEGLVNIRSVFPESKILYLLNDDVTQSIIDVVKDYNNNNFCGIIAYAPSLTEMGVKLAINNDIEVFAWGADSVDRSLLMDWGVTGLSTDYANIQSELL